jgi:2-polyprenyl-6-methoxyphenol hydroxylase-like FAD-dependent oxidoreductase
MQLRFLGSADPASMHKSRGRIAIVGGSMAGLIAGLSLLRCGYEVAVFEKGGDELASRGAGITPHLALFEAFEQAGIPINNPLGVRSKGRLFLGQDGSATASNKTPQLFASWGMLYRFLRRAFPDRHYHAGRRLIGLRQFSNKVELQFAGGARQEFDWLIGADGVRSTVRREISPMSTLNYAGYVAWRGLVIESRLMGDEVAELEERMAFYLPPGEHMLGYTVPGPDDTLQRGQRWYNWVWYRPVAAGREYEQVFTDTQGRLHEDGIPPSLIAPEVTTAMRCAAQDLLPPQFHAVVANTDRPFLQPIFEHRCEKMIFSRTILIGDAAFTLRPHIGLGVSKAAGDASSLALALNGDEAAVKIALKNWETSRLAFGNAALKRSQSLGCYLGHAPRNAEDRNRFNKYREPATVLAGIAAADSYKFLDL